MFFYIKVINVLFMTITVDHTRGFNTAVALQWFEDCGHVHVYQVVLRVHGKLIFISIANFGQIYMVTTTYILTRIIFSVA